MINARLDKIDDKLDKIADKLTDQAITHERNTVSLEEHIRRTDLLESQMLRPMQTDQVVRFSLKFLAVLVPILITLYLSTHK